MMDKTRFESCSTLSIAKCFDPKELAKMKKVEGLDGNLKDEGEDSILEEVSRVLFP